MPRAELPDSAEVSDTLGWVYYKRNMAQLAITPLEFSVAKDPKRPEYLLHLGLAYAKAGQPDKARETLQRALTLKSDVAGADEARAVLSELGSR
jgi:Tfp pilus assembly protein PilF